ncbi:MAG TPA: class I SAM-dependent methyltransferase [Chloroflexota bacterium]|nr:class I SAM-dependent methyltransferase [Chloroflexota bacterium]
MLLARARKAAKRVPAVVLTAESCAHLYRTVRTRWLEDLRTEMERAHEEAWWDFGLAIEGRRHERAIDLVRCRRSDLTTRTALEVGPSAGDFTRLLAGAFGEVLAIDVSQRSCALTRQAVAGRSNVRVQRHDLAAASVGERFDAVFLLDVLECLPGRAAYQRAVDNALAAIKPGGLLVLSCCLLPAMLEGRWWTARLGQGGRGTLDLFGARPELRRLAQETLPGDPAVQYPDHLLAVWDKPARA